MKKKFNKSNKLLKLVEKNIPLGSQTFSKSKLFLPHKKTPLFLDRGSGCHVYDVDGNKYIDLISGLLSVSIGYNIKEINKGDEQNLKMFMSGLHHAHFDNLRLDHLGCFNMLF